MPLHSSEMDSSMEGTLKGRNTWRSLNKLKGKKCGEKTTTMDLGGGSNLYMPTATKISHRQTLVQML